MGYYKFNNTKISAISACVPKNKIINQSFTDLYKEADLRRAIDLTGISERRIADSNICASDLCFYAADRILETIDRKSVDFLIFISQTPDYRQPATSAILQHRLSLSKSCGVIDSNIACSGYIYGLFLAESLLQNPAINRVLLLAGETLSKTISFKDKSTALLFGDAGTATLLEKSEHNESYYSLNTDGSQHEILCIKHGAYRYPSSIESITEKDDGEGNIKNDEQIFMDGMEVFNFTMREISKDVKKTLEFSSLSKDEIDYYIFHQANKFITDHIADKLKIDKSRLLYSIQKFGNTSAASIPLTIVDNKNHIKNGKYYFSGFGAGLSWGSAVVNFNDVEIFDLLEI